MTVEVNAEPFARVMRSYADIYGGRHPDKGLGLIILERARKLAFELYNQTKAIAPSQAKIAGDVQRLGWRIPEKFPDGRLGRGTPDQWIGQAVASMPKQRGRKSKARLAQEATVRAQKPTLTDMQNFVIKYRTRHTGFVATGWLGAISDLGGAISANGRGHAEIRPDEIDIVNTAPGCSEANAKHGFVQKAIAAQIADMTTYIVSRLQEEKQAA